jgi:tetratricopeptide (TPR) repeat protein
MHRENSLTTEIPMTKGKITPALTLFLALVLTPPLMATEERSTFAEHLEKANGYFQANRHFEAGDELQKATRLEGQQHPSLHIRLGILYYGLGLIPEAIAEGEMAVALAPSAKWYKFDLAKFYFVDKQYAKAEDQYISILKLDPGFTLGYYYLAELYYQKNDYDMAWLSLKRAILLGHQGKHLEDKLTAHTTKPAEDFAQAAKNTLLFRFIKCPSEDAAKAILAEITTGKLFESLELEPRKEKDGEVESGVMSLKDLKDPVAESLRGMEPYASPVIIKIGPDYRIMQRIVPFDPASWRTALGVSRASSIDIRKKPTAVAAAKKEENSASSLPPSTAVIAPEEKAEIKTSLGEKEKQQLSSQLAAFYALESWKNAWQAADVPRYLAAYSSKYTPPDDMDLATWKKKREQSLTRPKFIRLEIKDPIVEILNDSHLLITFTQSFESDIFQDVVIKTLTMEKEVEGWKISEERTVQELPR